MTKNKETLNIQGDISIHTDNILPIIKKWLYSENEIFIRELVSNASDAISKLEKIASKEEVKNLPKEPKIQIKVDKKEKTITISDTGLGLDAEEVQKYINQIAFSGAEDFLNKYKDKEDANQIIGHFGLGFYSAFIVSELVEIHSLSYKEGSTPILWSCDGSTKFNLVEGNRTEVGTDIILHLNADSKSYLEESKLIELVKKYANFFKVEIKVGDTVANDKNPLWEKAPKEVTEEEYKEFYKKLFPMNQDPLFWIHLNVDYPFNLKGILYFPKLTHELDASKGRIKLFCNQVFVTDDAKAVVPEFLTLLQGALDCPEIPLNVSRSYLQNDPYVKKISTHIVKKIADKLNQLYKKEKENYEKYWKDIHPFIKYGMMQDNAFYEKINDSVLFESSNGTMTTLAEYTERNKEKLDKKVLYCSNKDSQAQYINLCTDQGMEVLFLGNIIDTHFIGFLESKNSETKWVAVDSEISEHLLEKEEELLNEKGEKIDNPLIGVFKKALGNETLKVEVKALKSTQIPAMATEAEYSKRFKSMSHMMGGFEMPAEYSIILNSNNPIVSSLPKIENETEQKEIAAQLYDMAMMSQKPLSGDALSKFIERTTSLMTRLVEKK